MEYVVFVTCHGGGASHFKEYYKVLEDAGIPSILVAAGAAKETLEKAGLPFTNLDQFATSGRTWALLSEPELREFAKRSAQTCEAAHTILVDVGHRFTLEFLRACQNLYGDSKRVIVYLDNPNPYVLGEYSQHVGNVFSSKVRPREVAFASKMLANPQVTIFGEERGKRLPLNLNGTTRHGIGYYNFGSVDQIRTLRETRGENREKFLAKYGMGEKGQMILGLWGGANQTYMGKAFPHIQEILKGVAEHLHEVQELVLVYHPHGRAFEFGDRDSKALESMKVPGLSIVVRKEGPNETLGVIDMALYHQTSLAALFVESGIPTMQVTDEDYEEPLTLTGMVPICRDAVNFIKFLGLVGQREWPTIDPLRVDTEIVGFDPAWAENIKAVVAVKV